MTRAIAALLCVGIAGAPITARADDTYRLCGPESMGFIRSGKSTVCIGGQANWKPSTVKTQNPIITKPDQPLIAYNDEISYRIKRNDYCEEYESCWRIQIMSKTACKSLYAEASRLSASGANIGYTNASTAGVSKGQLVELPLTAANKYDSRLELVTINCRN